jgi:hypothetical protein
MKTRARQRSGPIKNALHLLLIAVAGLMPADRARAQTFTTLHDFTALSDATNIDGAGPEAGVVLAGAPPCMGRRLMAAVQAKARCSVWSSRRNWPSSVQEPTWC